MSLLESEDAHLVGDMELPRPVEVEDGVEGAGMPGTFQTLLTPVLPLGRHCSSHKNTEVNGWMLQLQMKY